MVFLIIMAALTYAAGAITAKTVTASNTAKNSSGSVRHLNFPKEYSIGMLEITPERFRTGRDASTCAKQIKGAQGSVTVEVPLGYILMFEANRHLFEHLECLNTISSTGIDCFDISMMPIDESEDGSTDKALQYIGRFKELKFLTLDRSDASDAGLANVKGMPDLEGISCFMCGIRGKASKTFKRCPGLTAST